MSRFLAWLKLVLIPPVGAVLIRGLGKTLRPTGQGFRKMQEASGPGRPAIFAFWHSQQLMMSLFYRGPGAHVLISQHRDGELIARIASRFGLRSVRGSTTRGGTAALRRMIALGRAGTDLAVTPDGPRGPRQVVQAGVIHLAKATGLPIVPLALAYSKKNFSRVGTASKSRCRSAEPSCSSESLFECRRKPPRMRWKKGGRNWRRFSTG
jgi:lysophospholipid acyltransferase (LPLAT)-like uncharacterized protein